jgi:Zn-dependent protease
MGLLSLLFSHPVLFAVLAVTLLYSIIVHEVAHGWVALLFGDDTARRSGRLTLNPVSHLDPLGLLTLFLVGFGWARPVPVNYARLKSTRLGLLSVSLASCAANILMAVLAISLLQLEFAQANPTLVTGLSILARVNIILGAFNLIPIPPLDGSKILMSFLPAKAQRVFLRFEPFGFPLLIIFLLTGLLNPVITLMQRLITALIVLLFGRA